MEGRKGREEGCIDFEMHLPPFCFGTTPRGRASGSAYKTQLTALVAASVLRSSALRFGRWGQGKGEMWEKGKKERRPDGDDCKFSAAF